MEIEKNKLIIGLLAILLLLSVIYLALILTKAKQPYSNNPKDWVSDNNLDIDAATKGFSYTNYLGQQYNPPGIQTVFVHDGIYLGNYFADEYKDNKNKVFIRFTPNLDPNDGIPDIFIVERIENNIPSAYIFIDEDWKNKIQSNVLWGASYQNEKELVYNEAQFGIYYDKINDDASRFSDNYRMSEGGIIVGKITKSELSRNSLNKSIYVRLR